MSCAATSRRATRGLDGYRAVLAAEPETRPLVGRWIAEAMQRRRRVERQLEARGGSAQLSADDIRALIANLHDIVATLADADPAEKAKA